MSWFKPLLKAGGKQVGKATQTFLERGIHKTDLPGLVRLNKTNPSKFFEWLDHADNFAKNGEEGGMIEMMRIQDGANAELKAIDTKAKVLKNTTTEISAGDKQVADELVGSEEGQQFLQGREVDQLTLEGREMANKERAALGYSKTDKTLFSKKERFDQAQETITRARRDKISTAKQEFIAGQLEDPVRAQKGYGIEETKKFSERKASKGFSPLNKDLESGKSYEEILAQHHLLFNAEGAAFGKQEIFKEDPAFLVASQRYIAKRYDAAFGEAAQNMANLPQNQVHTPYHKWLRSLKLDGVSGKNYEQFWKQKYIENPNMNAQQVQDAVDEWFQEIIFPSVIVLDDLMSKADLSKVNVKDIAFPDSLLKKARAQIQNELNPVKPTAPRGKGTTTTHDVQIDEIQTRAERGEFGSGKRSWFKEGKAREKAKEIVQEQGG